MILSGLSWSRKTKYEMMRERNKTRDITAYNKYRKSNYSELSSTNLGSQQGQQQLQVSSSIAASSSLLEQLPAEILQSIFILSANLHLPLCSKQLLSSLTSDHLKFEMTLQILHYQRQRISKLEKSALIARHFFDWEFVVKYARFANSRIQDSDKAPALSKTEDTDESSSEDESDDDSEEDTSEEEESDDSSEEEDDEDSQSVASSTRRITSGQAQLSDFDLYLSNIAEEGLPYTIIDDTKRFVRTDSPSQKTLLSLGRLKGLQGLHGLQMPEKLLHGTWDDDRLRLLRLLILFNCGVDHSGTASAEVAEMGVIDAIGQNEEEVVHHLLNGTISTVPTQDMLRSAMLAPNLSILFQVFARGHRYLDRVDPVVWRLFDGCKTWDTWEKRVVQRWLTEGVDESAVSANDAQYSLMLRHIEPDSDRWPPPTSTSSAATTPARVEQ